MDQPLNTNREKHLKAQINTNLIPISKFVSLPNSSHYYQRNWF